MLTLVLGGPGCGKTTALLDIIDGLFEKGVSSHRVGYLTFTRKAAHEGRERCSEKFGIHPDDLPYFSTLHSFAFQQLALSPAEIMSQSNYVEFGNHIGLELTRGPLSEEGFLFTGSRLRGDTFLALISFARITQRTLQEVCADAKVDFAEAEWIRKSLELFKQSRGVMDFTDLLDTYLVKGDVPCLEALIVDEAQDLSALQWRIIEKLAANTPIQYFAGDDDQAIYEWAGADVEYFLSLKGVKRVLPVSYRLKRNIFNICQSIVGNIGKRFEKQWEPHAEGGSVERVNRIEHVKIEPGTWLMLARNKYLLNAIKEYLYFKGFPFVYDGESSIDNDKVRAILYWENLRKGRSVTGKQAKLVYAHLRKNLIDRKEPAVGDEEPVTITQLTDDNGLRTTETWMSALRMPEHEREYYREIKLRGESLIDAPRITLSTIHGVKGGESDHVLLVTDMSLAAYKQLVTEPSSESRVFYVAASRARESLTILNPLTSKFYPLGESL